MAETFEAYRTRVLSYLGDEEPIGVQQATPSQLDRCLRDVAPVGQLFIEVESFSHLERHF